MKAIYIITLEDVKKACVEAVKTVPFFNKRRIIFSITFPLIALLFPLLISFLPWASVIIAILVLIPYFFFYGYGVRIYTSVKETSYRESPETIPMAVKLENENIVVERELTKQKITPASLFASIETDTDYVLFPKRSKRALVLIKKSPDNLSEHEKEVFNDKIRDLLKNADE